MSRYYTRVCNFYYGVKSKLLVKKKKTLPLHNNPEISFDKIEIITRNSKKLVEAHNIETKLISYQDHSRDNEKHKILNSLLSLSLLSTIS